jgi:hypothetical protein
MDGGASCKRDFMHACKHHAHAQAYSLAQQQICSRFGKQFTWDLKAKMMGKKALEAAQILVQDLQLHGQITPEEFVTEREQA